MKKDLYIDGIRYLTARDAGDVLGYAPDYISRLCRQGKLRGRRSGKSWIVEADSLVPFLRQHEAKKEAWNSDLSRELKSIGERTDAVETQDIKRLPKMHVAPQELHILRKTERVKAERTLLRARRFAGASGAITLVSLLFVIAAAQGITPQRLVSAFGIPNAALGQTAAITTLGSTIDSVAHAAFARVNNAKSSVANSE